MIQAIDRAAQVLNALQGARHLGISELARELDLAPSTVHGIVASLHAHGLVAKERGSQRYRLGPTLLKMSHVFLDTHEVRARAMQWTRELARRTGLSTRLGVDLFDEVLIIHHNRRPDGSQQMYETGLSIPAHASALGKVLLAYHPSLARQVVAAPLRALTGDTIVDADALLATLPAIVTDALAEDRDEAVLGESGLAAPIADRTGEVVAAIEVVGPTAGFPPDPHVANHVREAARAISRELGCRTWPPPPPIAEEN